jgi:hypothetical protein
LVSGRKRIHSVLLDLTRRSNRSEKFLTRLRVAILVPVAQTWFAVRLHTSNRMYKLGRILPRTSLYPSLRVPTRSVQTNQGSGPVDPIDPAKDPGPISPLGKVYANFRHNWHVWLTVVGLSYWFYSYTSERLSVPPERRRALSSDIIAPSASSTI